MTSKILQYVIVRKDILPSKKAQHSFTMGACMAQACHAATAAVFKSLSASETAEYLTAMEDMTVCVLGVENGDELSAVSSKLAENDIPHHLWIEKPEMIATALATAPVSKDRVSSFLSHLKLLR